MLSLRKKDLDEIRKTEKTQLEFGVITQAEIDAIKKVEEPYGYIIGHNSPAGANWGYTVAIIVYGGAHYRVIIQFGHILNVNWISLADNKEIN